MIGGEISTWDVCIDWGIDLKDCDKNKYFSYMVVCIDNVLFHDERISYVSIKFKILEEDPDITNFYLTSLSNYIPM